MPPANEKLIQHRCKNHVIIICLRSIFTCRNSSKKNIEDKIKINTCNHPTPKVHIYLQKQLKIDENIKINPCNHPTPKVHIYLQKHFKVDDKNKIKPCNHPTPKVQIYLQKQLKIDENIKIKPCNNPTPKVHIYLQKQVHNSPLQKLDRINETGRQYRSIT